MCVSFNNIYNYNGTANHGSIASIFNPNGVTILENEHNEIYITNTPLVYFYSASPNYLYVLDEIIRQCKEIYSSTTCINIHELQYLLGSIISLYGIYYWVDKLLHIYDK
jgi:hypothetical protein